MRIVDNWSEGPMKCTLFSMNSKFSMKIEFDMMELGYKFRDGEFDSVLAFKESLSKEFYKACFEQFRTMNKTRMLLHPENNT